MTASLLTVLLLAMVMATRAVADASDVEPVPAYAAPPSPPAAPVVTGLERLLEVPNTLTAAGRLAEAETADEAIAAAMRDELAPLPPRASGFRKRNVDLFRSEHPVEIGEQEMLLRLRLRAKSRETMSVELRF